jgi:heme/copper-type cytochrome/quinol oxidase subunit 2
MKPGFPHSYNSSTTVLLRIAAIITGVVTIFILRANIEAVEKDFPFYPGENLTFLLKWTVVPVSIYVIKFEIE